MSRRTLTIIFLAPVIMAACIGPNLARSWCLRSAIGGHLIAIRQPDAQRAPIDIADFSDRLTVCRTSAYINRGRITLHVADGRDETSSRCPARAERYDIVPEGMQTW